MEFITSSSKYIKTCFGEYINPALVKHFSVNYAEWLGKEFVSVKADDIVINRFPIEEPHYSACEAKSLTEDEKIALDAADIDRPTISNETRRKTRAKACAWLADFIADLSKED